LERSVRRSTKKVYRFSVEPTRGEKEETPRLPKFKPIKLSEVLRTKTGKSALNINSDLMTELILRVDAQQVELFRALGLDADDPDWAEAFLELAKIHHGVGIIHVEKARAPNKHAAKWSREQEQFLLESVNARLERGLTVTAALKKIASDKAICLQLPRGPAEDQLSEKSIVSRRIKNFRKRLELIKKRVDLENIHKQIFDNLAVKRARQKAKESSSK
jgi:hypothetical protein